MKSFLIKLFATGLGLGYAPVAPGTFGTLLGIPLVFLFQKTGAVPYMILTLFVTIAGCFIADLAGPLFGETDASQIVIDEVAGFLVTMTWLPLTWQSLSLGFLVFRLLDALKPGPIGYVERRIKGGVGVVADDIMAGLIANFLLQIVYVKTTWLGSQLIFQN